MSNGHCEKISKIQQQFKPSLERIQLRVSINEKID